MSRRLLLSFSLLLPLAVPAAAQPAAAPKSAPKAAPARAPLRYSVDLVSGRARHEFLVTLRVDSLAARSDTFVFAATAPGTYQVMDIGRFVRRFRALDARGREIATTRLSTNRWQIAEPGRVREIRYAVVGTRDTVVTEHPVYAMCGTLLRDDYALINGQGVFGFPSGMQAARISVRLAYPKTWTAGTALRAREGVYVAEDFDHLVDSPILLGRLTTARLTVTGVPIDIYTYSQTGQIRAGQLAASMRGMLLAAGDFLGKLPVDRYTFLFDFGDTQAGAWEHSYSSEYVLREAPWTTEFGRAVTDIAAHEFFHIVTPLNIHSEIIEHFDFATPVPSQHLWLYEGTTEWAAHKMQLEAGLKSADDYLATVAEKVRYDHVAFDTTYSLAKLALTSYSDSGQRQYGNIYMRGAVVAGLLDIALLEQSDGARGLRDLVRDLSRRYGKQRAFPEDSLYDIVAAQTSPEVREFFRRYVQGAEHPPVAEYYAKLGITVVEDPRGLPVRFTVDPNPTPAQLRLRTAWLGRKGRLATR